MWSPEDVARAAVRRQGEGLDQGQVASKVAEAARREQETREQLRTSAASLSGLDGLREDPERLAAVWTARHTEWRRVAALMEQEGWPVYAPEQDVKGSEWAQKRDTARDGALARQAAWQKERQDARDELQAHVWLPADASRRLRAIAARTGLTPEQILAQLAEHVRLTEDGALTAGPFTPQ
ncbi:hypothetical protein ACIQJT_40770 [Streptomyces sp. NPDC091972]|uniref:hypothetical protein n=1 Tax=Streptomyces sp. NPDC091972 TaxID=3366007 RepID=UPI0038030935